MALGLPRSNPSAAETMVGEPHIRVHLSILPTILGGPQAPFTTGFRPQFRYRGQDNDVSVFIDGDRWVQPGECTDAKLWFSRPDLEKHRLELGSSFMLAEGRKNIAHGHIVEFMEKDLISPAQSKACVIYVDVDDTLVRSYGTKQIPMLQSVQYVRAMYESGHLLYCWSRGGTEYARSIAIKLGIDQCFVCFLPKPEIVLDDRLTNHLDHCKFIHPNNAVVPGAKKESQRERSGEG